MIDCLSCLNHIDTIDVLSILVQIWTIDWSCHMWLIDSGFGAGTWTVFGWWGWGTRGVTSHGAGTGQVTCGSGVSPGWWISNPNSAPAFIRVPDPYPAPTILKKLENFKKMSYKQSKRRINHLIPVFLKRNNEGMKVFWLFGILISFKIFSCVTEPEHIWFDPCFLNPEGCISNYLKLYLPIHY